MARTLTTRELERHYKAGGVTVRRWLKEANIDMRHHRQRSGITMPNRTYAPRKPLPDDFHLHAHKLNTELTAMYECSDEMVSRWRKMAGIKALPAGLKRLPDDFAANAATMTRAQLKLHYGASDKVLTRWLFEAKVEPLPQKRHVTNRNKVLVGITPPDNRPWSLAEDAARHLRTERWIVNRARTSDPKAPDDLWRVGSMKLTEDQMLEFAAKKGWQNPLGRLAA